jgi:hypothetical protein
MRSVALVVGLSIVLISASGWSEVQYFKIPTPPQEPAKGRKAAPQKPVQADAAKEPADVSTATQQPGGPYFTSIQTGSHQTLDQARKEASRLKALVGIDTFIRPYKIRDKGTQYRVFIGKFDSKPQALEYQQTLKRKGIVDQSWIKRLRATPGETSGASTPPAKPAPAAETAPPKKIDKKSAQTPGSVKHPAKPKPKPVAKTAPAKKKSIPSKKPKREVVQKKPEPRTTLPQKSVKKALPSTPQQQPVVSKKTKPGAPPPKKSVEKTASDEKKKQPGRFYVGPRAGLLYAPGATDFRITRISGGNTEHWEFEDLKPLVGINIGWRFNDRWHLEALLERVVMANIKMQYVTLGPKMYVSDWRTAKSYVRAALVYGNMGWDKAPGDFDDAMGAEAGFGIDIMGTDFSFGLEAAYRHIAFDYNAPSGTGVTASDSQIDFSGFTLTGCARAHF